MINQTTATWHPMGTVTIKDHLGRNWMNRSFKAELWKNAVKACDRHAKGAGCTVTLTDSFSRWTHTAKP